MTRRNCLQLALGALWGARRTATANGGGSRQDLVVIVHPSNPFRSLGSTKLSYLFLKKVSRWPNGAEALPIDLAPGARARQKFQRQVLRLTEEQLADYWIGQRATRGIGPPPQVGEAAAARSWVAARPGGIAYIPASELDSTVKPIRVEP